MKRSKRKKQDTRSVEQRFPTVAAREAADLVIDAMPTVDADGNKIPMTEFIDTWVAAYVDAGGIRV